MAVRNCITIFLADKEPLVYDLDSFQAECVRLGRGPFHGDSQEIKNDIAVGADVSIISRAHCSFYKTGSSWFICDDKSVNGLFFNGVKIQSQQLHDGDKFYVGQDKSERCVIAFSCRRSEAQNDGGGRISLRGQSRCVLGRDKGCDVILNHPSVSRRHCIITCENNVYYISDNNSMNGVILNGSPLNKKQRLEQMDKITVADTSMVFCDGFLHFTKTSDGVSVFANEVTKKVKAGKKEKCIADHVSLSIEPGEFVAIIGGSGAGKTTLLNCLSGMADFTSGDVLINGESIQANSRSIRSIIGYVPQSDIVYDNLTLERMLYYSAQLRMPKDTSKAEIEQKINETLEMVELTAHRHTVISRLSGGQRKRASIAVELLASPKLFFLDEPSSGLDPGTEKHLMHMLKRLALTGKTVVMVTHTVQNIGMCDRIVCMGNGGLLCFSGTPQKALEFFGKDNMIDIYDDLNNRSAEIAKKAARPVRQVSQTALPVKEEKQDKKADFLESVWQFRVMTGRYAELTVNSKSRLILLLLMPVLLTLLVCLAYQADGSLFEFFGISVDRNSWPFLVFGSTRSLLFAFSCAGFWVGIFNSIQEVSKERTIYDREHFTGVRTMPYIMSKFVMIGILCVIQSAIMVILFLCLTRTTVSLGGELVIIGIHDSGVVFTGAMWLEFYITTLLSVVSAMCLGLTISSAVSNEMALVICPVCLLPQMLFSGVVSSLSGITRFISYFIVCRWSCIAYFTSARLNDLYYKCEPAGNSWQAIPFMGKNELADTAYSPFTEYLPGLNPVAASWLALLLIAAVCLGLAVFLLHVKKRKR